MLYIPMKGKASSLNLNSATACILMEFNRNLLIISFFSEGNVFTKASSIDMIGLYPNPFLPDAGKPVIMT